MTTTSSNKKRFRIQETKITPYVEYIPQDSILRIKGRSSPQSSMEFYFPIIKTIKKYPPMAELIQVEMKMEYFNTSSSKCIFDIFRELEKFKEQGHEIQVQWYYEEEDEDMLETGEDFELASGLQFKYFTYTDGE